MESKVLLNTVMILRTAKLLVIKMLYRWINIVKYVINISNLRVNIDISNQIIKKILINVNIYY